jgi:serine/threonine protein kinase
MARACPVCSSVYSTDAELCPLDGAPLTADDANLGAKIGPYEILQLIGSGSYGSVYRAHHTELHFDVALKMLKAEVASNGALVARFAREAVAMQQMNHPNIVGIVDLGIHERIMYIAMELVEGKTLEQLIARESPLTEPRAAAIAKQIALGLNEAHRLGFIHRDLKPGNVLLVEGLRGEQVKLVDFGVTAHSNPENALQRLTMTGFTVGTPLYMAPEQIQGGDVGPEADIYSLGAIIYHMLAGRPPFEGSMTAVITGHLTRPPQPIPESPLATLTFRLLEKQPEKRPRDALHVVNQLALLYPSMPPIRMQSDPRGSVELDDDTGEASTFSGLPPISDSQDIDTTNPTEIAVVHRVERRATEGLSQPTMLVDDEELRRLRRALESVSRAEAPWLWEEYEAIHAIAHTDLDEGDQALLLFRVNSFRRRLAVYVDEEGLETSS